MEKHVLSKDVSLWVKKSLQ